MNSCMVGIDLGVTSEHVACISDGDGKPSKKTIRFSRRHCKSDNLDATTLVRASLIDAQSLQEIQLTDAITFALKRASCCCRRPKVYFSEKGESGHSSFREVVVNEFGAIPDWPKGFFDQSQFEAEEILRAAAQKRRLRREDKNNA